MSVTPDETSYHQALNIYCDDDEIASVNYERFGVDKEGNIFALVRFYHTYWANMKINYDKGDYELLKWNAAGEFILPRRIFGEDALSREVPDDVSGQNDSSAEEPLYVIVDKADPGTCFYVEKTVRFDGNKFLGVFYDERASRQVMGIFTPVE